MSTTATLRLQIPTRNKDRRSAAAPHYQRLQGASVVVCGKPEEGGSRPGTTLLASSVERTWHELHTDSFA